MSMSRVLSTLLFTGILFCTAEASSLQVYQNKGFYSYSPDSVFIGVTQGIHAKCEGKGLSLIPLENCPQEERLCKLYNQIRVHEENAATLHSQSQILQGLISLPQPSLIDAANMIDAAKQIGTETSRLEKKEKEERRILQIKKQHFSKQTPPRAEAVGVIRTCTGEMELTLPYGYLSFSTSYEADLSKKKEITVTQYLSITNRSGIDINADDAMFYYRSAQQYLNPLHFNPWIVSKYEPRPKKVYRKTMMKEARMDMALTEEMAAGDIAPVPALLEAGYEDAREYRVSGLHLPSTGEPLEVKVLQWKVPLSCELRTYPYALPRVFEVCSFTPKYQVESHRWKLKEGKKIINENAVGEYAQGKYDLYVKVDEDIKISRRPIVKKERETGIFGGTIRKKDGYTLEVINKSDKSKTVRVIERIPTSTTEEIKVKLLEIKSESKIDYKRMKEGKIEIKLDLKPNERKKLDVWFEISYDKDLKVSY